MELAEARERDRRRRLSGRGLRPSPDAYFELNGTSIKRYAAVHRGEKPKCAFTPDVCALNFRPVFQDSQQREHCPFREIGMGQLATCLTNSRPELKVHRFHVR